MSEPGKICIWTVRPGSPAPFCGLRGVAVRPDGPTHDDIGARFPMRLAVLEVTLCAGHLVRWDAGERDAATVTT